MSHRALVAIPTNSNNPTYDVYRSRNGAEKFKLHPLLKSASGESLERLQELPHRPPRSIDTKLDQASHFDGEVEHPRPDEPIVQTEPLHTDTTIEDLLQNIDYLLYDALYVAKGETVTTYFLSWAGAMMHSVLAANGVLRIHPPAQGNPVDATKSEPYYRVSGDAFLDLSEATRVRPDAPPIETVRQELAHHHMGIFRNLRMSMATDKTPVAIVHSNLTLSFTPNNRTDFTLLGITCKFGVCINADIGNVPPDIVWRDLDKRANTLRWNHMKERNHVGEETSQNSTNEHITRALNDFEDKNRIEFGSARSHLG
jgi:hypothetical protein